VTTSGTFLSSIKPNSSPSYSCHQESCESNSKVSNPMVVLSVTTEFGPSSQMLTVSDGCSCPVLFYLKDLTSGAVSGFYSIRANTTLIVDPHFSLVSETAKFVAVDASSNLQISKVLVESITGYSISTLSLNQISRVCQHTTCSIEIVLKVTMSTGLLFSGVLKDSLGELVVVRNGFANFSHAGIPGSLEQIHITAQNVSSNILTLSF